MDEKDEKVSAPKPAPRKKHATYLPDSMKLIDALPLFPGNNQAPEIILPLLRLALYDLLERFKSGQVIVYHLHSMVSGEYGRYTADLCFNLQGQTCDAHIDIIDRSQIAAVLVLNVDENRVDSVYPHHMWQDSPVNLSVFFEREISEIIKMIHRWRETGNTEKESGP